MLEKKIQTMKESVIDKQMQQGTLQIQIRALNVQIRKLETLQKKVNEVTGEDVIEDFGEKETVLPALPEGVMYLPLG